MGIASLLLGENNPFAQWTNQNQNLLGAIGAGLGQGQNIQSGLSAGLAMAPQAKQLDLAASEKLKAEKLAETQANATTNWIQSNYPQFAHLPPQQAWQLAMEYEKSKIEGAGGVNPTSDIQNYEYAQSHPGFLDFQTQKGGAAETSLTPTWGTDSDPQSPTFGQTVLGQLNKAGQFVKTALPPGVAAMDPRTLAGERASGTVDAKTAGAARAALPGATVQRDTSLQSIDRLTSNEKGLQEWFGQWGTLPRGMMVQGGTEMGNWVADFSQAEGQAFLQARQFLKGQGAITEVESAKAELAYSRMKAAKETGNKQNFLEAAADFRRAVEDGFAKLQETAQGGYSEGNLKAPAALTSGNVDNLVNKWLTQ